MNESRRTFLKKAGLASLPLVLPAGSLPYTELAAGPEAKKQPTDKAVNFIFDGIMQSPGEYLEKLREIDAANAIAPDVYGQGGVTAALEEAFARLCGKEKAIYLPSGTMANQLAIKLLNGDNTKVIVAENSHIFRDEADAAQRVHQLRLVPVGKGKPYFNLELLQASLNELQEAEVFKSGLGTVAIESPVRRADGAVVPLEEIKNISAFCKAQGLKLHLDGARLHMAAAFRDISIAEYAAHFDTVYISLYKYLNADGGAILCGPAALIDRLPHQIKIHGGTMYSSWHNTAMAYHSLQGLEARLKEVAAVARQVVAGLNSLDGVTVTELTHGSNIFMLKLPETVTAKALSHYLYEHHRISFRRPNADGLIPLVMNESLLHRKAESIVAAWQKGIKQTAG